MGTSRTHLPILTELPPRATLGLTTRRQKRVTHEERRSRAKARRTRHILRTLRETGVSLDWERPPHPRGGWSKVSRRDAEHLHSAVLNSVVAWVVAGSLFGLLALDIARALTG